MVQPLTGLRTLVAALANVTSDEISRRITSGAGSNVSREQLVERTVEVLDMMRWAASNGLGLYRDFSA